MQLVYSTFDSPRLRYVLDWILGECFGLRYALTHDENAVVNLSYGKENSGAVCIPDEGFLRPGATLISPEKWTLKQTPFDMLSAVFFLLSRAEEYKDFEADKHGRYAAKNSILFEKGWLQIPVVDVWLQQLRNALGERFHLSIPKPTFTFQPTYDIDIAYSYLHKGFRRTLGGILKDSGRGKFGAVNARLKTLSGRRTDPYDAYEWLRRQHEKHGLKPVYFILAAMQNSPFDKNISPLHPVMKMLAQRFSLEGTTGIHPSYSTDAFPEKTGVEKNWLEAATGQAVYHSRQHYIRLRFPQTYQQLISGNILHDWSMGYPDDTGFRAGTSRSFLWYDLEKEQQTALRIYPFCFMDTTARDYLQLPPSAAFERLENLQQTLIETGGVLTTIFHNFSLGAAPDWPAWREGYSHFLNLVS